MDSVWDESPACRNCQHWHDHFASKTLGTLGLCAQSSRFNSEDGSGSATFTEMEHRCEFWEGEK